jgi:REP element-mobilizing transposase RayT
MSKNYYSEINHHLIWHTKLSSAILTGRIETLTHEFSRQKLVNTPSAFIHEIGGTDHHIHLAISIAPTILISDLVGKLKGASSHGVNQRLGTGRKSSNGNPATVSSVSERRTWIGSRPTSTINDAIMPKETSTSVWSETHRMRIARLKPTTISPVNGASRMVANSITRR